MKRSHKLLSLILTICIAMSMLTGFAPANAVADSTATGSEVFELPDIVDSVEAKENDYVGRVEAEEKDLYTFVFANGDGTNTMRIYSHPVKYVADDGSIRDISLDIEAKRGGGFVTADHEIVTTFESKLTDGITLEYNDVEIMLVPELGLGTMPTAELSTDGKVVTYEMNDITSFVYELTYAGFKEDIVVEEYTGQTEYEFTLFTNGLTLCEEYGSYYLADAEGNVEATIGDIIVFTADERNNAMGSMTYETVRANQEYVLTIHLDADYLADEDTVYPIRIDPTIEINYDNNGAGAIEDVTINQNSTFSGTSGSLYVGRHPAGSLSRVLMRFPNLSLNGILADQITAATVEIRDLMCQGDEDITVECRIYNNASPAWSESGTTTWSSVGTSYAGTLLDSHVISYGQGNVGNHRYSFNILTAAKAWANGTQSPAKGLVFKANSTFENQTGNAIKTWYKTFSSYNRAGEYRPSLSITYSAIDFNTAITATLNTTYPVSINSPSIFKCFKFVPAETGIYSFISSANAGDPYARLYNSSEQQIDVDDDSAGNRNFCLSYHLMSGVAYYFAVSCYNAGTGSYNVCISKANSSSKIDCTTMTLGTVKSVNITTPHKIVCYKVTPTETKEYLFFSSNKTGDPEIWVYNSSFGYVTDNDDGAGGLNFRLAVTLNAGTTYYIVLRHNYSSVGSFGFNSFYDAKVANSTYLIKNIESSKYVDIDGPGAQEWVHQWSLHTSLQERWEFQKQSDGFYTIRSKYGSKKYVGVSSSSVGVDNIKLFTSISDSTKWKIYASRSGNILFEPKSASGKVLSSVGLNNGVKLQLTNLYICDSNYGDRWNLTRMNPTNGYEITYNEANWSDEISNCCNCYAYALNNQVYPGYNLLWFKQQPGEYSNDPVTGQSDYTEQIMYNKVLSDYNAYNTMFSSSLSFQRIGQYDVCPAGTYKVALVVDLIGDRKDYHWYRQDSDGFWSHKQGTTPVKRTDESGELIVDPYYADRGEYTQFLGYYAVTPWNNMYSKTNPVLCYVGGYFIEFNDLMEALEELESQTQLQQTESFRNSTSIVTQIREWADMRSIAYQSIEQHSIVTDTDDRNIMDLE